MMSLLDRLIQALQDASRHNSHSEVAPVAVLWTDPDRLWMQLLPEVRRKVVVLEFGEYAPEQGRGPLAWIKTALAGKWPGTGIDSKIIPIVYLPGIAIATLRETRECPVALQPLVELVHRGTAWCQQTGRDVTPQAFLSGKEFLRLDLARDAETAGLLPAALKVLFARDVEGLNGERIDAAFLQELLQPDLARSVLAWIDRPEAWKAAHAEGWKAFASSMKGKAKFDVERDGPFAAIELLTFRSGIWAEWWSRFEENPRAFPGIMEKLQQLPESGLVSGATVPAVNLSREEALRHQLEEWVSLGRRPTDEEWRGVSAEYQERSQWVWYRLDLSPVLGLLGRILELRSAIDAAVPSADWSSWYGNLGWKVDDAALRLARVAPMLQSLAQSWVRLLYVPWLEQTAMRFQADLRERGLPAPQRGHHPHDGEIQVFVDGLRMDVARRLAALLEAQGIPPTLEAHWSTSPSVTATGKAMISPLSSLLVGTGENEGFVPRFGAEGALFAGAAMKTRLQQAGVQCDGPPGTMDAEGRAWVELGDFDSDGHAQGWRLVDHLDRDLEQLTFQVAELVRAGWSRIRIVTDHGWLLVPGGLPACALPKACAEERWGRCAVLKPGVASGLLELPWSWNPQTLVAYPPGISCFKAGEEYAHGGLSPQEMIIPQLLIEGAGPDGVPELAKISGARWTRLKCRVELQGVPEGAVLDLRSRLGDPGSSLLAEPKRLSKGDEVVSLFVEDDDREGDRVYLVLEVGGAVVDKRETVVGVTHAAG